MAADHNWVTCICQACNGSFLFDAYALGQGETHTPCPNCNADVEVAVPAASKPAAVAEQLPEEPVIEPIRPVVRRARKRLWIPATVAVGLIAILTCLGVFYGRWKREHVQITAGETQTIAGSTMYKIYELQGMTPYEVTVHNGARFAMKDIKIGWVFYDKSGTALTTYSKTFHETLKPGQDKSFKMPAWSLPGETVRSRASVRSVGRVW
jgi:hypothetical protein